jgi:hypothetical protein
MSFPYPFNDQRGGKENSQKMLENQKNQAGHRQGQHNQLQNSAVPKVIEAYAQE